MKEETLIYFDEKKRKAVFKCGNCSFGKIGFAEKNKTTGSYEYSGIGECQVCKGTGVRILDIPKL